MTQWAQLVGAFARFVVERYGAKETATWFFEVR